MTRDPAAIRVDLATLAGLDAEVRDQIARTRATIASKQAETETLIYHVDMLLCSQERRRILEDTLLDELLGASSEGVTAW